MICKFVFVAISLLACRGGVAQGPENTLVVVNEESFDSVSVANQYIHLRGIPASNVLYLRGITSIKKHGEESSSTKRFEQQIRKPLLRALKDRGIEKQIDCVAYSAGFPTRINFQPELTTYLRQAGKKYDIHFHAPWTSITSLTYFHENAFSDRPDFLELDANNYAALRRQKLAVNPFVGGDAKKFDAAMKELNAADYTAASGSLLELARKHPLQMAVVYPLARCFAFSGEKKKTITTLRHALVNGFGHRSMLKNDPAFQELRSDAQFKSIIARMTDLPDGFAPTRSFSSRHFWASNGWPSGTDDQGERYLLSSVLAVTGKNQSTLEDSLTRLESSVGADGTKPTGHVYFADHKDPRSRTRKQQFPFAVAELKTMGREASIGSDKLPKNNASIIGVTLGSPVLDWNKSGSKFLPGAICDNFTSYGGFWQKTGQTQLSEFLDAGAAGACGTVYEPYTIPPKIPTARWHAHYGRGATLAESFYQSISGPFQTLLVGDPLCCPFGEFPEFEIEGLQEGDPVKDDFELRIKPDPGSTVQRYEMFYDGVLVGDVKNPDRIQVDTGGMNDGFHELRIVAISRSRFANKASRQIGFQVNRKGNRVDLSVNNSRCVLGKDFVVTVVSSSGKRVKIRQNFRTVATLESGKDVRISSTDLGLGKFRLQAVVELEDGTLEQSAPIDLEVVSN